MSRNIFLIINSWDDYNYMKSVPYEAYSRRDEAEEKAAQYKLRSPTEYFHVEEVEFFD